MRVPAHSAELEFQERKAEPVKPVEIQFRTVEEVRDVACKLARACPEPDWAIIGLTELLVNAVEHGNLELSYYDKSRFGNHDAWQAEIDRRLADARFADRFVIARLEHGESDITITIRDQGQGFDYSRYLEFDASRLLDTHGRGIAMARYLSFDQLEYRDGGREVVATLRCPSTEAERPVMDAYLGWDAQAQP